jgi:hypothetical protein
MPDYRASWYSQLPEYGWNDPEDRPGSNALGVPDYQQGIALPSRRTLGQWFDVTSPSGETRRLRQTDIGPAGWTGRDVDISAAAAHQFGYTPTTFPANAKFTVEPIEGGAALPPPRSPEGKRAMPNSLFDMFTPSGGGYPAMIPSPDAPASFSDALAQRQNSLIGLGLGLMSGGFAGGMRGYAAGSDLDIERAKEAARLRESAADRALRLRAQQYTEMSPFERAQRDITKYAGTPQGEDVKRYWSAQLGEAPQLVKVQNPETGEDESVLYNPRSPSGSQFTDLAGRPISWLQQQPRQVTAAPPTRVPYVGAGPLGTGPSGPTAVGVAPSGAAALPGGPWPATPGAAGGAAGGPADQPARLGPKAFEPEQKLRKEFMDETKVHQEVRQSYNRILASKPDAAGDLALIYGFMKMLDPRSVVRESEFATAQNAAGVPEIVRNTWNRVLSGERLPPEQRTRFMAQSGAIQRQYQTDYDRLANQYSGIARQYRIDPKRVIPDLTAPPTEPVTSSTTKGPVVVNSRAERNALDPGTPYIAADDPTQTVRTR